MPPAPNNHRPLVALATRHALSWLVTGNAAGLWLSLLLAHPRLTVGDWTYGRWAPVHLNVQLFGWSALPLVAWLLFIYETDHAKVARWAPAAVWAWSAALAAGALAWLGGQTSGKIFLDWRDGPLWGLVAALGLLWIVLALSWRDRASTWTALRRRLSLAGLAILAMVPPALVMSASPHVYPPVDATTGGPSGASLLGSTLVVVSLMMLLPRAGAARGQGRAGWGLWTYLAACWLVFAIAESMGGSHYDFHQIGAMAMLVPWVFALPWDWSGFEWQPATLPWRAGMLAWWALLTFSAVGMYFPGPLDHIKFTQALVGHTHLAMAGFTTSFCALALVAVGGRRIGGARSALTWHLATLVMVTTLAVMGLLEGGDYSWMLGNPWWRSAGLALRSCCGITMLAVSAAWWFDFQKT